MKDKVKTSMLIEQVKAGFGGVNEEEVIESEDANSSLMYYNQNSAFHFFKMQEISQFNYDVKTNTFG
jgi:hypothetical protein